MQLADGQMERDGQMQSWRTVGVYRIADGKIAECWLLPFDQYLFDEPGPDPISDSTRSHT